MQTQLLTSKSEHWCTPEDILNRIRLVGTIGLDPCANQYSIVGADTEFDLARGEDGLLESWQNYGLTYVNPPYGRKLLSWVKKMAAESVLGTEIVATMPARTDTKWFHEYVLPYATSICLWKGRIKFIDGQTGKASQSATFPSMFVYYGPDSAAFYNAFEEKGYILEL